MTKYKTAVVDYEGMQDCLDQHASQGWRLFCVNADTWRKVESAGPGDPAAAHPLGVGTEPAAADVYSASYYLLVFMRDEDASRAIEFAEEVEELPRPNPRRTIY
jgi:hypothetical protein